MIAIDWLPIEQYTPIYYHFILVVVLLTVLLTQTLALKNRSLFNYINVFGLVVLTSVLLYMGLRPIKWVFTDMITYANIFKEYQEGSITAPNKDIVFHLFIKGCSKIMDVNTFFFICAILYVIPLFLASRKISRKYWFYLFLMFIASFSFWTYGVNGIRNGIATSLFILAVSFHDRKIAMFFLFALAYGFHGSLLLPILAYVLTMFYNQPKYFFVAWLVAIPLSLALGSYWQNLFTNLGFGDDRLSYLTDKTYADSFSSTGFRWDFLLYSATGVLAGWYYVIKHEYKDAFYFSLLNVYLVTNAFWILVIGASFSNRFAYLSWFMLGLIIIYPTLKQSFSTIHHKVIGGIILVYFLFTYFMNVILL